MEEVIPLEQPITYCLYARKSSESDERQAMSIDSQIKEMGDLARKENLVIKEVRQESHSAKESGQRLVFNQILADIRTGFFTGILTWAPDRLSRNAGDLGMLVDLMDQGKLQQIKTYSQNFSNNPNEKFLLMILCSQAKLENDQKGINVKRGIRAKCEMGWRPGIAPLGYMNRAFGGVKDIIIDPDRAPLVQEMFQRVAKYGHSGRTIKKWLDQTGFTTRQKKNVTLSLIYLMLRNSFYYGKFEFPANSGIWYEGKQPPLISKDLFDQVQEQLKFHPKSPWGSKVITYKGLFKCGNCQANMIGEEKYRKRKHSPPNHHIYYHCARQMGQCREPYIDEKKLEKQILKYIQFMEMAHGDSVQLTPLLKKSMEVFLSIREEIPNLKRSESLLPRSVDSFMLRIELFQPQAVSAQ
jgi:site-specific DNA recombinase